MNYYTEIKNKLLDDEIYGKVKDYSKERHRVITYYEVGKLLNDAGKHYGEDIIGNYSKRLVIEVGKKYNKRTLFRMRQFYNLFKDEKVSAMLTQLTWSHYLLLLSMKDYNKIIYYINQAKSRNLTQRQLQEKIRNNEYDRLIHKTKDKIANQENLKIDDLVPNPIIINKTENNNDLSEYALKQLILNHLDDFLLQLGPGFTYVGNEYRIRMGNTYNYVDLLFYNIEFNSYVVVELKVGELKKEHIGQIQVYMNYIDDNLRRINQDKTIGIIISKKDNKYIIEYSSDERILSREYKLVEVMQ